MGPGVLFADVAERQWRVDRCFTLAVEKKPNPIYNMYFLVISCWGWVVCKILSWLGTQIIFSHSLHRFSCLSWLLPPATPHHFLPLLSNLLPPSPRFKRHSIWCRLLFFGLFSRPSASHVLILLPLLLHFPFVFLRIFPIHLPSPLQSPLHLLRFCVSLSKPSILEFDSSC